MRFTVPLDDLLRSRTHIRLLRALHQLPEDVEVSIRDLGRRAAVSHPTAARVLRSLEQQGLVQVHRLGRTDAYRLNRAHHFYPILRSLFVDETRIRDSLIELLRTELPRRLGDVQEAYLFGSAARADMRPDSDIDVGVSVRSAATESLSEADTELRDLVRAKFGNELNLHFSQVSSRQRGRKPVHRAIAREGIQILPARNRRGAA